MEDGPRKRADGEAEERLGRELARKKQTHTEGPTHRGVSGFPVGGNRKRGRSQGSLNRRGQTSALGAKSYD